MRFQVPVASGIFYRQTNTEDRRWRFFQPSTNHRHQPIRASPRSRRSCTHTHGGGIHALVQQAGFIGGTSAQPDPWPQVTRRSAAALPGQRVNPRTCGSTCAARLMAWNTLGQAVELGAAMLAIGLVFRRQCGTTDCPPASPRWCHASLERSSFEIVEGMSKHDQNLQMCELPSTFSRRSSSCCTARVSSPIRSNRSTFNMPFTSSV